MAEEAIGIFQGFYFNNESEKINLHMVLHDFEDFYIEDIQWVVWSIHVVYVHHQNLVVTLRLWQPCRRGRFDSIWISWLKDEVFEVEASNLIKQDQTNKSNFIYAVKNQLCHRDFDNPLRRRRRFDSIACISVLWLEVVYYFCC